MTTWKELHVGEIVKLKSDEFVPADMLLLHTSDPKGACFVETKNLDGETNLKIKSANKDLHNYFGSLEQLSKIDGQILCEKPNNAIYKFEGAAEMALQNLSEKISLNADNVLLRGSSVRNTDYVYGVIIFTGHDTKVMKNSANSKYKFSKLELLTNFSILIIFCLQVVLAAVGAILGTSFSQSLHSDSFTNS